MGKCVKLGKWIIGQMDKWANGQMGKWENVLLGILLNGQMGK